MYDRKNKNKNRNNIMRVNCSHGYSNNNILYIRHATQYFIHAGAVK